MNPQGNVTGAPLSAGTEAASVALEVLSSLSASIPQRELASARGLLITRTHRAALGFGIQTGTAVALRRLDDGQETTTTTSATSASSSTSSSTTSSWSAPLVFAVRRASFGVSYGYATVDSVLLLKTDEEARLLAAGAPAIGTEHRFVSSVLDNDDEDEENGGDDSVEVEVEGSGLDKEVIRSELEAAAAIAAAGSASGDAKAVAAGTTAPPAPPPGATAAASSSAATLPPTRSAVLFSRSSGALVDMSVVAGMLSLDSAAHAALYCSSPSLNASAAASSAPTTPSIPPPPPPPEPEDVLAGKVERPVAFASVYELLEKMEHRGQQQGRGRE